MQCTFRLAHLAYPAAYEIGDTICKGDIIGIQGSTGKSTGPHGHLDVVMGRCNWIYRLAHLRAGQPRPAFDQMARAIGRDLTGGKPFDVTTFPYDYRYLIGNDEWQGHPAYDIVIRSGGGHYYWPFDEQGTVINNIFDGAYGNVIQIYYKVGQQ